MEDKIHEALGMLLRGLLYQERSGGRTPEHLAGQVRRTLAILSPVTATEVERNGVARVYEERWERAERATSAAPLGPFWTEYPIHAERALHCEQRHPDYEYLTTTVESAPPHGEPPAHEGWEPNAIVRINYGPFGPHDPPRYRNWEVPLRMFTTCHYWRRRKGKELQ